MLCHCWFIVCLMNAWILSKGNSQRIQDVPSTKGSCEEGGNSGFNECEECCECRKGELTNCYRVRQDFTKMTIEQRKRFINTYKLASVHPLFKRDYEKTVTLHLDAKDQAKLPHIFLAWHRWFLVEFENLLHRIDCRVTIPYWNWSKKTHHWWRGSGNEDLWNSGDHGLGGDGSVHGENCVENGPFSKDKWRLLDVSGGGCLKRKFLKRSIKYDVQHVNRTLSLPLEDFENFEGTIRVTYHNEPHSVIGGTMVDPLVTANAPEMLLHHSFVDKLWYEWQKRGDEYKNAYFPRVPFKLHGSNYYVWEWIRSSNLPGQVKVLYEE